MMITNGERILVIGGAGYIGTHITGRLLEDGYKVRIYDSLIFGAKCLMPFFEYPNFELIKGDIQSIHSLEGALENVDGVILLAGLANDPSCDLDFVKSIKVNYISNVVIAKLCHDYNIRRFLFASSCAVYGASSGDEDIVFDEHSPRNPLTVYARSKALTEDILNDLGDATFKPTCLRLATVFGPSRRMRFDLVVNTMTGYAYNLGKIKVNGGSQYRPNVHVDDVAEAFVTCLKAPVDLVGGETYNVGSFDLNYKILDLAEVIAGSIEGAALEHDVGNVDERSYKVSFTKIEDALGYRATRTIEDGVKGIIELMASGAVEDFKATVHYNVAWIQQQEKAFE